MKKTHLIWDLSGTLLKPSKDGLSEKELNDFSLYFYMWSGKPEPSALDREALSILNRAGTQQRNGEELILTSSGELVPQIICDFLAGKISAQDALHISMKNFEAWNQTAQESFKNREQIKRMLACFFLPTTSAQCMKEIAETVALVRKCRDKKNLLILSNWDRESFTLVYKKFAHNLFDHFTSDHIVISGQTGFMKPRKSIYTLFLEKNNLDPADCFFIDDQGENIEAAQMLGIEGLIYTHENLSLIDSTLESYGFYR
jgi:HAD superfamily hydrolase (TIGR01509 family)